MTKCALVYALLVIGYISANDTYQRAKIDPYQTVPEFIFNAYEASQSFESALHGRRPWSRFDADLELCAENFYRWLTRRPPLIRV